MTWLLLLLACSGPAELDKPNPPPTWPMAVPLGALTAPVLEAQEAEQAQTPAGGAAPDSGTEAGTASAEGASSKAPDAQAPPAPEAEAGTDGAAAE